MDEGKMSAAPSTAGSTESGAEPANALSLSWTFGLNKDIRNGVHCLSDDTRNAIFFVSAHSGVIYDFADRSQQLLQGHCNPITACCVSDDKRWIATADAGPDSMIVIWDSLSATPIKTIFNPHPNGVQALAMTPDAMFIATLSAASEDDADTQQLALWEWTVERDGPLYTSDVYGDDVQTSIAFNPTDVREVVTNGKTRVMFWNWESKQWKFYSPALSKADFPNAGVFTQSTFIPDTHRCITATENGSIVLWDRSMVGVSEGHGNPTDRRAVKLIPLSQEGIQIVTTMGEYIVVGGDDGAVRFYDFQFRIQSWFEDLDAGPITSVSFANQASPPPPEADGFTAPDFVVGTSKALVVGVDALCFHELTSDQRRGMLLTQGVDGPISGMCVHPTMSRVALVASTGTMQLWDFQDKRLLMVRVLENVEKRAPIGLEFDPLARFIAITFSDGTVQLVGCEQLQDLPLCRFRESRSAVRHLGFSHDGQLMATADEDRCVGLFMYTTNRELLQAEAAGKLLGGDDDAVAAALSQIEGGWVFIGRSRTHGAAITALSFGVAGDGRSVLMSVADDRRMIEYDLENSSINNGLMSRGSPTLIDVDAQPTAGIWYPASKQAREDLFVTANSEYKFKLWNWSATATQKTCRKTVLGPTYGGPLTKLVRKPPSAGEDGADYMAYATSNKVAGLIKLPLDGNPARAMGLVAHPSDIGGICFSSDGRWLLTCGTVDMAINLWAVDTLAIEQSVASAGEGVAPFLGMIDGGADGEAYNDMVDYFYYSQLRAQGEMSTDARAVDGSVPLEEIPNLMRAMGYYPTEHEIENMTSEVKYASYLVDGQTADSVSFDDFLKLYVNHRPVFGISKEQIQEAFKTISQHCVANLGRRARPQGDGSEDHPQILWGDLTELMQSGTEALTPEEFDSCLQSLVSDEGAAALQGVIGPLSFADRVLGFEDYDEGAQLPAEEVEGERM